MIKNYMVYLIFQNGETATRYNILAENDGDAVRNAYHGCRVGGEEGQAIVFCELSEIGIKYDFTARTF